MPTANPEGRGHVDPAYEESLVVDRRYERVRRGDGPMPLEPGVVYIASATDKGKSADPDVDGTRAKSRGLLERIPVISRLFRGRNGQ